MGEKKTNIPVRLENFVKGLAVMLISAILFLHVGRISRILAFPFIYLFGAGSYIIFVYVFIRGAFRVIFNKPLKIKSPTIKFGLVMLFIASLFLFAYLSAKLGSFSFSTPTYELAEKYHSQLNDYLSPLYLNLFGENVYYGGGLLAMLLSSLFQNDAVVLIFTIVLYLVALFFIFITSIVKLAKHIKTKKEEREEQRKKEQNNQDLYVNFYNSDVESLGSEDLFENDDSLIIEKEPPVVEEEPIVVKEETPIEEPTPVIPVIEEDVLPEPEPDNDDVQFGFEPTDFSSDNFGFNKMHSSNDDILPMRDLDEGISDFERPVFAKNNNPKPVEEVKKEEVIVDNTPLYMDNLENSEDYLDIPIYEDYDEEEPVPASPKVEPQPVINNQIPVTPVVNPVPEVKKEEPQPVKRPRVIWNPPAVELLDYAETAASNELNARVAKERQDIINQVLANFKVNARCASYTIGSSVTRFNIEYDPNVSSKSVEKLISDIARQLGGVSSRFTPLVEGETFSGLEVPNPNIATVSFREVFESLPDVKKHPLAVAFGKNISGDVIAADYDEFPHLLVAGTTGSGKSIYIHSIIATLIMRMSPDDLRIVLVDPKKVEMTKYRDMPHLLCPIITESAKAKVMLSKLVDEMNDRYERFADADSCSNIKQYNEYAKENGLDLMPYIIVVLDEYADLVDTCKEISQPVVSIAQKARAAGIHLLISTQRPSTNVITGVIKGNLPTHVALMTSSYTDSMTILGSGGAETLLGKGDMLVQSPLVSRVGLTRLQGCYIQNKEIGRIVGYLKEHYETHYDENYLDLEDHSKDNSNNGAAIVIGPSGEEIDPQEEAKYQSIKAWVMTQSYVSMSRIQRDCSVGFNRAGRFLNRLQKEGIVSMTQDGATKGCKVLIHDDYDNDDIVTSGELID